MNRSPVAPSVLILVLAFTAPALAEELKDLSARAGKGEAAAQFELGRRYATGQGVAKDEVAALQWFLKAAAQGHAKAEVSLGSIYAHGFGVKQDWAESIRWYRQAAFQGDTTAQHNLGLDYAHGHGVEQNPSMAARWFRLAADQGHARAQYNLGELTEEGRGVAKSDLDAYVLYHLASAHDNLEHLFGQPKVVELIQKRDRVGKRLTPAQLAEGRKQVRAAEALEAVHPRRFGSAGGVGPSRGWYIWRRFDPDTWEAEVAREGTDEVWKVRVLPWLTTFRYLVYGARPDELLSGERVNFFFSADENHRRGYLVHFQPGGDPKRRSGAGGPATGQGRNGRACGDGRGRHRPLDDVLDLLAASWSADTGNDGHPANHWERPSSRRRARGGPPAVAEESWHVRLRGKRYAASTGPGRRCQANRKLARPCGGSPAGRQSLTTSWEYAGDSWPGNARDDIVAPCDDNLMSHLAM